MEQGISKQKIINNIEFSEPPGYDKIKEDKVKVSFVQGAIEKLVTKMNSDLISTLNIQLENNGSQLTNLIKKIGDVDSGLIQSVTNLGSSITDLGSRITELETDKSIGGDVWS